MGIEAALEDAEEIEVALEGAEIEGVSEGVEEEVEEVSTKVLLKELLKWLNFHTLVRECSSAIYLVNQYHS